MIDVCLTDGLQKPRQQLHYLPEEGVWYVHCKHCEVEKRLNARNEEEAYGMLGGWQLSMPQLPRSHLRRNWSCPKCVDEYWNERDQLKAEVVQLKAEVAWLKAAFVELKCADTKQTTDARPGATMVVAFTEDEAKEIRDIAEGMRELAQQMLYNKTDMCSPCSPQGFLADLMEDDGNTIVTLSSRLLELLREQSRLRGELHGHYARVRERDEEILARAFPTAPDDAVPDDTRDAVDTAVPQEAEKTSHDG